MSKSKKKFIPTIQVQSDIDEEAREATLTVTVDESSVQEAMRLAARQLSKKMNIPGFRKGRAPYSVVRRMVGEDYLREESVEVLLDAAFPLALEQSGIEPYRQASLKDFSTDPMVFSFSVPLEPQVEVGDVLALRVPYEAPTVSEEEIDAVIEQKREEMGSYEEVERPAREGDLIAASPLVLKEVEGEKEHPLHGEEEPFLFLLNDDIFGPAFKEAVVGIEKSETRTFTFTLPEDEERFGPLAGKEVEITLTVQTISEPLIPPVDEAFANAAGYESLEAMREAIREELLASKQREVDQAYARQVMDALLAQSVVRYPEALRDEIVDILINDLKQRIGQAMRWEDFLRLSGKDEAAYREELAEEADRIARESLVLSEVQRILDLPEEESVSEALLTIARGEWKPEEAEATEEGATLSEDGEAPVEETAQDEAEEA